MSTMAQVMACCLTAPSHYLNQCCIVWGSKMRRHAGISAGCWAAGKPLVTDGFSSNGGGWVVGGGWWWWWWWWWGGGVGGGGGGGVGGGGWGWGGGGGWGGGWGGVGGGGGGGGGWGGGNTGFDFSLVLVIWCPCIAPTTAVSSSMSPYSTVGRGHCSLPVAARRYPNHKRTSYRHRCRRKWTATLMASHWKCRKFTYIFAEFEKKYQNFQICNAVYAIWYIYIFVLYKRSGLLSQFPPFRYNPNFSASPKYMLAIKYHGHIWQVSPQLSCGDICQIWMWYKEYNRYFGSIENLAYGEINERSFSNPHPSSWWFQVIYLPIFPRVSSLALRQPYDCPSASEVTLKDMVNSSARPQQR